MMLARAVPIGVLGIAVVGLGLTLLIPAQLPPYAIPLPDGISGLEPGAEFPEIRLRILVQFGITLLVLCAAIFVILAKRYKPPEKNWAFGAVGTILGFWLRASEAIQPN